MSRLEPGLKYIGIKISGFSFQTSSLGVINTLSISDFEFYESFCCCNFPRYAGLNKPCPDEGLS